MYQDLAVEFEDGGMRRGGPPDPAGNGGCPPRCGGCVVGIVEFCVQLPGGGVTGGAGG